VAGAAVLELGSHVVGGQWEAGPLAVVERGLTPGGANMAGDALQLIEAGLVRVPVARRALHPRHSVRLGFVASLALVLHPREIMGTGKREASSIMSERDNGHEVARRRRVAGLALLLPKSAAVLALVAGRAVRVLLDGYAEFALLVTADAGHFLVLPLQRELRLLPVVKLELRFPSCDGVAALTVQIGDSHGTVGRVRGVATHAGAGSIQTGDASSILPLVALSAVSLRVGSDQIKTRDSGMDSRDSKLVLPAFGQEYASAVLIVALPSFRTRGLVDNFRLHMQTYLRFLRANDFWVTG